MSLIETIQLLQKSPEPEMNESECQGGRLSRELNKKAFLWNERRLNPRPAGVFGRARPAGGGGEIAPLLNSRAGRRSKVD